MIKPHWDDYFLAQCFLVAMRSPDPATKHGAVLVSRTHRILATGYNGSIAGSAVPDEVWLQRPEKYIIGFHAEANAITNYYGSQSDLEGATMYVTGEPCFNCLKTILQKGVRRIVYGHVGSKMVDQEDQDSKHLILSTLGFPVEMIRHTEPKLIKEVLFGSINYLKSKE